MAQEKQIGKPLSRLEGALKVTGKAKYAGEYEAENLLYGYVVNSVITKGKIKKIQGSELKKVPGIVEVFTHKNRGSVAWFDLQHADMDAPPGRVFRPLEDATINYNGQPVALVVAESFELARYGASILKIDYEEEKFQTDLTQNLKHARHAKKGMATLMKPPPPEPKGNFQKAYDAAPAKVSATFLHSAEHHNPMEMHATTTIYEGKGKLKIYNKTQGTSNDHLYVSNVFGLHMKDVRVVAPFVGGAFGSGLRPQYPLFLSVMAALRLKRNVRVTLDREQMFTFGHRPQTLMQTQFAADKDGKLQALKHMALGETSRFEDYTEGVVPWGNKLYPVANTLLKHKMVPLDTYTPLDMRAPGGATGVQAVEITMDELATELNIDPLELRLINYAEKDDTSGKPWSSKELREAYLQGAAKFGWEKRNPEPRSTKRGNWLVGHGMATGGWEVLMFPASAKAILDKSGRIIFTSAITDIGTGTLTVMSQIAADEFGVPTEAIEFVYADSNLPFSPIQGGSAGVSSVGSAIKSVAKKLKEKLLKKAQRLGDKGFRYHELKDVIFADAKMISRKNPEITIDLKAIAAESSRGFIKAKNFTMNKMLKSSKFSKGSHSAAFVEVEVHESLGTIRVTRAVTAVAAGSIINPKTARSQILGGMVWGISHALMEGTIMDHNLGRYMNTNLAEYHIPVHADIGELDVVFVKEEDKIVNELGSKGLGEIGIVAMAPAISNAIFNATGKRLRNLPMHFDELL